MSSKSPLRTLVEILSGAVNRIESQYEAAGLEMPSLDTPFDSVNLASTLLSHPDVIAQASLVVAAAEQLAVAVRPPRMVILENILAYHRTSCLYAVEASNVAEILRDAGPQGLPVHEISAKNGLDTEQLSRILRLLATHNIFNEVSPDVFAHNRVSSIIDTGKPISELSTPPTVHKYPGTNGMSALIGHIGADGLRASGFMTDYLTTPAPSPNCLDTPFNRAFNEPGYYADWLNKPGNELSAARLHEAMQGTDDRGAILQGFPWESLPAGSKVVDVGGGIGSVSMTIAKACPELKIVVQDLDNYVPLAEKHWNNSLPGSIESGRVEIQGHDFFQPQPVKDAAVFFLRFVIHNWNAPEAIKILRRLREAAVPGKTKLMIIEKVITYACKGATKNSHEIEGLVSSPAPEPLLGNFGRASAVTYLTDIQMLVAQGAPERTIGAHIQITEGSGWKITHAYSPPGSATKQIVAEAV